MFLLGNQHDKITRNNVFVSYIRRYVLTKGIEIESVPTDFVFVSYIRRYVLTKYMRLTLLELRLVFVSYIRRYVLTTKGGVNYESKKLFSSPIFGDMFLLDNKLKEEVKMCIVFVSYIRRYVLTRQC